ncbi:MAG TPA: PQQ-binding-like beta-propeller repeat protein [Lamprocystis sp. (in: g-proteobacteria)]|nr:PQQ-binding-like beta-propeller repeat protein [Lamprocystis sp. (in: g-proteobacteria)]
MSLSRRRLLATVVTGCLVGRGTAAAGDPDAATRRLTITRRWPTGDANLAPLALAGGRLAFAGGRTLGIIALDGLALAGGGVIWQQAHGLPGGAVFSPRLGGGLVVCGGHAGLGAWDLATGESRWRYTARVQAGVPYVDGLRVYVGDGHEIVALDLDTGAPVWRFAGVPDTLVSYAPVGDGPRLFCGPGDGRLYALAAADGTALWVLDRRDDWQYLRQLRLSGEVLVAGSYKEKLFGIDTGDGREHWVFNAGNFINSHHVADGTAYLWSPTGWVYAINAASGQVRWRHRTTDFTADQRNWAPVMAELATHGGVLYALAMDGVVHRLDQATGAAMASLELPEPVAPSILPTGSGLFFASRGGEVLLGRV